MVEMARMVGFSAGGERNIISNKCLYLLKGSPCAIIFTLFFNVYKST